MAIEWGNNTIGAGQTQSWFFVGPATPGFLPVLSVRPLTPSFTNDNARFHWASDLTSMSFPVARQLGVSTIWSQMSDDQRNVTHFMLVMNYSDSTLTYSFLESDV
jgi:hypothetical protein